MQRNLKKPSLVYLISEGATDAPRKFTEEEINSHFELHDDTGWVPKLRSLYDMIGAEVIDCASMPGLGALWFDDEGKLSGRTANPVASSLYNDVRRTRKVISGNVLLVPTDDAPLDVVEKVVSLLWKRAQDQIKNAN